MKNKFTILLIVIWGVFSLLLNAQSKENDVVYKKDGESIVGKLIKVENNKIWIDPKGEISLMTLNGEDIEKIELSNGEVIKFPLEKKFSFNSGESSYNTTESDITTTKQDYIFYSLFGGIYRGDKAGEVMGIQSRFDNSSIFGLKAGLIHNNKFPLIVGIDIVVSFSKYSMSAEIPSGGGTISGVIEGFAINLDMSGEWVIFDIATLYIPNPFLLGGFGTTRFLGDDVNELDLSLNFGGGVRIKLSNNFGIGINYKNRIVYVQDMDSPNFTEISCELLYWK